MTKAVVIAVLLAGWSFVLGPALCLGGMVAHPCGDGQNGPAREDDHHSDSHGCPDDPCNVNLARTVSRAQDEDLPRAVCPTLVSSWAAASTATGYPQCGRIGFGLYAGVTYGEPSAAAFFTLRLIL